MNLVLDTNVLIAAFIAKGFCHTLVEQCLRVHSVITSEFILNELSEKLTGKFKYSDADASAVEVLLRSRMRVVDPTPLESNVCRDPDDDMVLATALTGKAACIITGDKDLLSTIADLVGWVDDSQPTHFLHWHSRSLERSLLNKLRQR